VTLKLNGRIRDPFICRSSSRRGLDAVGAAPYLSGALALGGCGCQSSLPGADSTVSESSSENTQMAFRPLGDRVLVKRVEEESKTKGGIIIPDTAKEKPQEGEVVAVGPGARDERGIVNALELKAGDRILFGKWSGTEVKLEGEDLIIMKESDVLGVL
jgi:chaperonin GroES